MQHCESMCHLHCDICPSLSLLPFATSCAGLAHYHSGNLGCGEIVVISGSLLLKVEDWLAAPSLFCNPWQERYISVGRAVSWSCHGVGRCPGCVQIKEHAEPFEGAVRLLWGCVSHPSHGFLWGSPGDLSHDSVISSSWALKAAAASSLWGVIGLPLVWGKAKTFPGCTYFIYKWNSEYQAGRKWSSFLQVTSLCCGYIVTALLDQHVLHKKEWTQHGLGLWRNQPW